MKLSGNTMLVTGGGSGIGQALAWEFQKRGNRVIVAGRTRASLEQTVAGRSDMDWLELDVGSQASVDAAIARLAAQFPDLNGVIHAAGIMSRQELGSGGTLATAEQIIETNLLGTFRVVEGLLPHLSGKPNAVICTMSSGLAFVPLPSAPAYSASKAAVHSYTVSLRERMKGLIEIIEIAPPAVRTGLTPGQEDLEAYLPLADYIDQTMVEFEKLPTPEENLVPNARWMRDAEKEGRLQDMLTMLGKL